MAFPPSTIASDKADGTAIPTDHPAHHNALAVAINDTVSEVQTWTVDRDANTNDLVDLGQVVIGANSDGTGQNGGLIIDRTFTDTAAGTRVGLVIDDAATFSTTAGGTYAGINATPSLTCTANMALVFGLKFDASVSSSATTTTGRGGYFRIAAGASHTITTAQAIYAEVRSAFGTVTTGIGVDVATSNASGTFTTAIGLRITSLAGGSTIWGIQVGAYQGYYEGDLRVGAVSAGSTASPAAKLDVIQPTIGSEVQRLTSVATGDDVQERVVQGQITTTNATPATIITVANPASTTVGIDVAVVARRTGGSAGSAEDGAFFRRTACFKNVGGTATEIGADGALSTQESQAGYDVTVSGSSGNIVVQVTGIANTNMTWHATARVYLVSS